MCCCLALYWLLGTHTQKKTTQYTRNIFSSWERQAINKYILCSVIINSMKIKVRGIENRVQRIHSFTMYTCSFLLCVLRIPDHLLHIKTMQCFEIVGPWKTPKIHRGQKLDLVNCCIPRILHITGTQNLIFCTNAFSHL